MFENRPIFFLAFQVTLMCLAFTLPAYCWAYDNACIVLPKITVEPSQSKLSFITKTYTKSEICSASISKFKVEFQKLKGRSPSLHVLTQDTFYDEWEEQGRDYLSGFLNREGGELLIFGTLELYPVEKIFNITLYCYDSNDNSIFPVNIPSVSIEDIEYMESLYVQAFFEVFNEIDPLD